MNSSLSSGQTSAEAVQRPADRYRAEFDEQERARIQRLKETMGFEASAAGCRNCVYSSYSGAGRTYKNGSMHRYCLSGNFQVAKNSICDEWTDRNAAV